MNILALLAPALQRGGEDATVPTIVGLVVGIFAIACIWQIFSKAGQPGWYAIIPVWNTITLLKISGRPWWWILLMLIPLLNIVLFVMLALSLGKSFGKGAVFSIVFIMFLSLIGLGILAFGNSRYVGPGGRSA